MKFEGGKNNNAGNFLKLGDGDSVKCFLAGDLSESWQHWVNKRPIDCTEKEQLGSCAVCNQMTTEKTVEELKKLKPKFRFQVNAVLKENENWTAKIFSGGWAVYSQLKDLNDGGYDVTKHLLNITRKGMEMNTKFTVMPTPNGQLDEKTLGLILEQVKLHDFKSEAVPF